MNIKKTHLTIATLLLFLASQAQACYEATYASFYSQYNDGDGPWCYVNGVYTTTLKSKVVQSMSGAIGYGDTPAAAISALASQAGDVVCDSPSSSYTFTATPTLNTIDYMIGTFTYGSAGVTAQSSTSCPPPPPEEPTCGTDEIADPDTGQCRLNCGQFTGQTREAYIPYQTYIEGGGLNGCSGDIDYSTPVTSNDVLCDLGGSCWIKANYTYNGSFVPSGTYDVIADPNRMQQDLTAIDTVAPQTAPTYSSTTTQLSQTAETLPDGTTVTTTVTQEVKQEDSWIRNETTGEQIIIENAGGDTVTTTTTTTESVAPDGTVTTTQASETVTTTVQGDTYTITNNGGGGITISNVPGTTTTATTGTTQTTTVTSAGGDTLSTSSTSDTPPTEPGEITGTVGALSTPAGTSGDEEYSTTVNGMMSRLQSAPIIVAFTSVFEQTLPTAQCPLFSLNLPWGTVSTTFHCEIMTDINSTLYPLMLAVWGILGAVVFLKA